MIDLFFRDLRGLRPCSYCCLSSKTTDLSTSPENNSLLVKDRFERNRTQSRNTTGAIPPRARS